MRAGLVRCGTCKEIFNGIEHLLRPDEPVAAPTPAMLDEHRENFLADETPEATAEVASAIIAPDVADAQAADADEKAEPTKTSSRPSPIQSERDSTLSANPSADDPFQRMTLMDFSSSEADTEDGAQQGAVGDTMSNESATESTAAAAKETDVPDPIADAIDALQHKPHRRTHNALQLDRLDALDTDESDLSASEEPSFVKRGRRKQQFGAILRILMAIGSVILSIGLVAQGVYVFRSQIATQLPQVKPALAQACLAIGCSLDVAAQIDAVSIESSELQTLTGGNGVFTFTTLLRNHGATAQAWPSIELTLNDANEKPLARRVFTPREYLPANQDLAQGFGPVSEQSVKLFFALSQLKPSGYRVYLFYP